MSIEDEARKQLERKRKEEADKKIREKKEKARMEEGEKQRLASETALAKSLFQSLPDRFVEKALLEIRDKYWGFGNLEYIPCYNGLRVQLITSYEAIDYIMGTNDEGQSLRIAPKAGINYLVLEIRIVLGYGTNPDVHFYVIAGHKYGNLIDWKDKVIESKSESFKTTKGKFVDFAKVKNWINSQLSEYVIAITGGDVSKRHVFDSFIQKNRKEAQEFKVYQQEQESKGCWKWIFG